MKKLSALIFDCDGVMFDSKQANINYYNYLLSRFNLPPLGEEDFEFVHSHTSDECVKHLFRKTLHVDKALAYKAEISYTPFIREMIIEPGLMDLLISLKPFCALAVATNRSDTITEVLKTFKLDACFDIVVSSLDVQNPKPHPEPIIKILDYFGINPEEALYIGDSDVDSQVCQASGVSMIAYRNRGIEAPFYADSILDVKGILTAFDMSMPKTLARRGI